MRITPDQKKRGSALAAAVIISACVGMVAAASTKRAQTERRLNYETTLSLEARNAAEAVVEYGFADLSRRFDSTMAFPTDALAPKSGSDPLKLPTGFFTLFSNGSGLAESNVVMPGNPYNPMLPWGTYETELIGGVVPPGEWTFISPNAPGNAFDPLRGMNVFVRAVKVYGRATVEGVMGQRRTAYCSEDLQVRDSPLFANAIFYNMDLEIAPSPYMTVVGTVHANGNMYVMSSNGLHFQRSVTAVGDIFHGPKPGFPKGTDNSDVTFINGNNNSVTMRNGGGWYDSTSSNWRSVASNRWAGNVQDAAFGVQASNPVAIQSYSPDTSATSKSNDDTLNYAYSLIMPLDKTGTVDKSIEKQKYAYKAGLIVEVTRSSGHINGYVLKTPVRDINGEVSYSGNTPQMKTLAVSSNVTKAFKVNRYSHYYDSGKKDYIVTGGMYDTRRGEEVDLVEIDMHALRDAVHANKSSDWGEAPEKWWNGVVYVDFGVDSNDTPGPDGIQRSYDNCGVRVYNAQSSGTTPGIPDPHNPNNDIFSTARGTTIATNNTLYVRGHYNADGSSSTGSPTNPDRSSEPPAALVADAVTILSHDWNDSNSHRNKSSRAAYTMTEVSAAILTGIVPSDKYGNNTYSGGVENFPRFLESWKTDFVYRGSMVALFESEIATEPWGGGDIYDPPGRRWGFNQLFAQGLYPPGTPNTRTYRRVNFRFLTEDEWNDALSALKSQMGI